VIHLVGGPGGSVLDAVNLVMKQGGTEILKRRDYILFNQRGTPIAVLICFACHSMSICGML